MQFDDSIKPAIQKLVSVAVENGTDLEQGYRFDFTTSDIEGNVTKWNIVVAKTTEE